MKSSLHPPLTRFVPCLFLALFVSCASMRSGIQGAYNSDVVGRIAKEFTGSKWVNSGDDLASTKFTGRFTVLIFFDPAAGATASFMDELTAFHDEFQARGVVFFGVTDADELRLSFFLEEHPLPFPVLTESPADRMQYGIKKLFQPEILLVDPYARILCDEISGCTKLLHERLKS